MEVSPERSNFSLKGLIVSSTELHIIPPEGLRLPRLTKLLHEELNVSSVGPDSRIITKRCDKYPN